MISSAWLLVIYCALVLIASLAGGWLLLIVHPTHRRIQMAISFVAGLMLGIALLHFLPDAEEQLHSLDRTAAWMLGGFLAMFFLQRFSHFHHHDSAEGDPEDCDPEHITSESPRREQAHHAHSLAEKSAQAASQIDAVTHALADQSLEVEKTIQRGQQSLTSSQDYLESVVEVMATASDFVSQATQGVDNITSSVKEQRAASTDIAQHIEQIAQMAESNSMSVNQTAQEAQHLEQLAHNLSDAVSRFKA